jgi:uncharacterized Zn-binding protein involved in type VI secretion
MGQPITVTDGLCFAFPDVCLTPAPPSPPIPVPYPNIAQLADATGTASNVNAGGKPVVTEASSISQSTGDDAGSNGGVTSGTTKGECKFTTFSTTVKANGKGIVRLGDSTTQNKQNAVGTVLGGLPTVLVGG